MVLLSVDCVQVQFRIPAYMVLQKDINPPMRTILVDWLIEVQENFELFHETLYLSVKLTDRYLSRKDVKREYLQLVGATSMLIASKFEVWNMAELGGQYRVDRAWFDHRS